MESLSFALNTEEQFKMHTFDTISALQIDAYIKAEELANRLGGRFVVNVLTELSHNVLNVVMRVSMIVESILTGSQELLGGCFSNKYSSLRGFKHFFLLIPKHALKGFSSPYYSLKQAVISIFEHCQQKTSEDRIPSFLQERLETFTNDVIEEKEYIFQILC